MESFKRCDGEPVSMKVKSALVLSLFFLSFTFNYAYAQEPVIMEQVTPNGKIKVQLSWPEVLPDQLFNIGLTFVDPKTNKPLDNVSIGYDVIVLQRNATIEKYDNQKTSTGFATFEVVFPVDGAGPAQVIIAVTSTTNGSDSVKMDEMVSFNVQVVPEFPAMVAIVMGISIMMIVVMAKLSCKTFLKMN